MSTTLKDQETPLVEEVARRIRAYFLYMANEISCTTNNPPQDNGIGSMTHGM